MKKVIKTNRPVITMKCKNENCLCEFKTDEYKRTRILQMFRESYWEYRDTCPLCNERVFNVNMEDFNS